MNSLRQPFIINRASLRHRNVSFPGRTLSCSALVTLLRQPQTEFRSTLEYTNCLHRSLFFFSVCQVFKLLLFYLCKSLGKHIFRRSTSRGRKGNFFYQRRIKRKNKIDPPGSTVRPMPVMQRTKQLHVLRKNSINVLQRRVLDSYLHLQKTNNTF